MISDTASATSNRYVWGAELSGRSQGAGEIDGLLSVTCDEVASYQVCGENVNITEFADVNSRCLDTETGFYYYGSPIMIL
jgi:hypothetical protein